MSSDADHDHEHYPRWVTAETAAVLETVIPHHMPPEPLAIFARWWQFETWLRDVAYLELRSRYGIAWNEKVAQAVGRQRQDAVFTHMPGADNENPIAYLDYSQLVSIIDEHRDLFDYVLFEPKSWQGRQEELKRIRHRIGHMRRPHADDLARLEQTLRDLERGAFIACASYNRQATPDPAHHSDAMTLGWVKQEHPTAARLIDHADRQYGTRLMVSTSRRPWASSGGSLEARPGLLWHAHFYVRDRTIDMQTLWRELRSVWPSLVHVLSNDPGQVELTFSAVDGGAVIADAIGYAFDALLFSIKRRPFPETDEEWEAWRRRTSTIDYRVLVDSSWSIVDDSTLPISMFGAGGGVQIAPDW